MPYSYIWIVAKDQNGVEVAGASIMEGDECLGRTGGDRPLPLDPRVYRVHVLSQNLTSDERKLVLEPNSEDMATTEVFVLKPSAAPVA